MVGDLFAGEPGCILSTCWPAWPFERLSLRPTNCDPLPRAAVAVAIANPVVMTRSCQPGWRHPVSLATHLPKSGSILIKVGDPRVLLSNFGTTHVHDILQRVWKDLIGRSTGPMNLRLILQPTVATILAIRAGLADARHGRPAFLWGAISHPAYRREFLRQIEQVELRLEELEANKRIVRAKRLLTPTSSACSKRPR